MVRRCNAIYLSIGKMGGKVFVYITEMNFEERYVRFAVDVMLGGIHSASLFEVSMDDLRYRMKGERLIEVGGEAFVNDNNEKGENNEQV